MNTRSNSRAAAVVSAETAATASATRDNPVSTSSGAQAQISMCHLPYGVKFPEIVPKQLHEWAKLVTNFLESHNITSSIDKFRMLTSHLPSQLQLDVAGFLDCRSKTDPYEAAIKSLAIHYRTDARINYNKKIEEIKESTLTPIAAFNELRILYGAKQFNHSKEDTPNLLIDAFLRTLEDNIHHTVLSKITQNMSVDDIVEMAQLQHELQPQQKFFMANIASASYVASPQEQILNELKNIGRRLTDLERDKQSAVRQNPKINAEPPNNAATHFSMAQDSTHPHRETSSFPRGASRSSSYRGEASFHPYTQNRRSDRAPSSFKEHHLPQDYNNFNRHSRFIC